MLSVDGVLNVLQVGRRWWDCLLKIYQLFSCLFDNERFGIQDVRNLEVSEDNFDGF